MKNFQIPEYVSQYDDIAILFVTKELPFANWSAHQITVWGQIFSTVEHAFQYKKFEDIDTTYAQKIKLARSPYLAKRYGRAREINSKRWDKKRLKIMMELIKAKREQHEDVQYALRNSKGLALLENGNPNETFWGIGRYGNGQNMLGKIWMKERTRLDS